MRKNNFLLLIFYIFMKKIISQTLESESALIDSPCTTIESPLKASTCNKLNMREHYCCFLSEVQNPNNTLCYLHEISKYHGQKTINYKQTSYSIYCGLGSKDKSNWFDSETKSHCGEDNPSGYQQCTDHSTETNSCCFYKSDNITGCYWLGSQYYGSYISDEISLVCQGMLVYANLYFHLVVIFILIIV